MELSSNSEREMNKMLLNFERDATFSLRNIRRSGSSLNSDFRQKFLQMSKERLETTYSKIQLEAMDKDTNQIKEPNRSSTNEETADSNGTNGVVSEIPKHSHADSITFKTEKKHEQKNRTSNSSAVIEIIDSSDDDEASGSNDVRNSGVKQEANRTTDNDRKVEEIDDNVPVRTSNVNANERANENVIVAVPNDRPAVVNEVVRLVDPRSSSNSETVNTLAKKSKNVVGGSNSRNRSRPLTKNSLKCPHCDHVAANQSRLVVHIRKHTGEKPYKCSRCGKKFTQSGNFNAHMKLHEGRRDECIFCGKTRFPAYETLKRHMRIHTIGKPFQCIRCSKQFTIPYALRRHMVTHKNKKLPFYCRGCFSRFSSETKRENHEKVCRCRRYECHLCKEFITIDKLQAQFHMRSKHSGDKPFQCSLCKKSYTSKSDLNKHSKNIHGGINKT